MLPLSTSHLQLYAGVLQSSAAGQAHPAASCMQIHATCSKDPLCGLMHGARLPVCVRLHRQPSPGTRRSERLATAAQNMLSICERAVKGLPVCMRRACRWGLRLRCFFRKVANRTADPRACQGHVEPHVGGSTSRRWCWALKSSQDRVHQVHKA